jgi:chromosomal replication initiation ATPase DnaA
VPRHLLMYFLMKEGNTCVEVGKELNRTHVTVMHGYRAVLTWLEYPSQYTNEVELYERVKTRLSKQQEQ